MQRKEKIDYVDYYPYGQFPYNYTKQVHTQNSPDNSKQEVSAFSVEPQAPANIQNNSNNNFDISKLIPLMLSMQDKSLDDAEIMNTMIPLITQNNKELAEIMKYMTKTKKTKKSSPKPLSFDTNIIDIDSLERID